MLTKEFLLENYSTKIRVKKETKNSVIKKLFMSDRSEQSLLRQFSMTFTISLFKVVTTVI